VLCCKVPTITSHQTTIFCPVNTPWHIHAYDDDHLCVYYQKNQKMMDLLKHSACLFWCGDDLHHGHTDEIRVDSCIRPLLTEYSKLKWHLLTGEGVCQYMQNWQSCMPPHILVRLLIWM